MIRRLLTPDPAEGVPPVEPPTPPVEPPAKPLQGPPAPPTEAAPPKAAKTVLEGTKTEREAALEADLKKLQTKVSTLEDENRTLKTPPPPPPKSEPAKQKKGWLEGGTFFE